MHVAPAIVKGDFAQAFLMQHLSQTEHLLRDALHKLDPGADCQVVPAADLGIPYDALRLVGGFATGCVVDWQCNVPVIPIDITMNIDTSSIFWLSRDPSNYFSPEAIEDLRATIESASSYEWNFNRSNHFIALCKSSLDDRYALVLHSNEKEFKDQFNGLCPTKGNWYEKEIISFGNEGRIRLTIGDKAVLFANMAAMLEEFNIIRHKFIAVMLVGAVGITNELHRHHYYMPSPTTAAIGCYLCVPGEDVPVFSAMGRPLAMFRPLPNGHNQIILSSGEARLIVPHGWGMTVSEPIAVSFDATHMTLNGTKFPRCPGISLLDHHLVRPRVFTNGNVEFFDKIREHTPGVIVYELNQVASYSQHGYVRHVPAHSAAQ